MKNVVFDSFRAIYFKQVLVHILILVFIGQLESFLQNIVAKLIIAKSDHRVFAAYL